MEPEALTMPALATASAGVASEVATMLQVCIFIYN